MLWKKVIQMIVNNDIMSIYDTLVNSGLPENAVFAIMGNMYVESALRSNNMQNSYENKLGYNDDTYTYAVDNGSYSEDSFAHDSCGYGLCQWTYWSRKQALLAFAKEKGCSVANPIMQAEFCIREMQSGYKAVWNTLCSKSNDLYMMVKYFCVNYEKPANQSESAILNRYNKTIYVRDAIQKYLKENEQVEVYLLPKSDYDTIMAILNKIKV